MMSEFKNTFKDIKAKNKSSEDGINSNEELAYYSFCEHTTNLYEEKEHCFDFECKRAAKYQ